MLKNDSFEKKKNLSLTILVFSLALIFSSPNKSSFRNCYNNVSLPWARVFFLLEHVYCISHHKTHWTMLVDNVGLKICLLGTSNSMVTLTFSLGVNRSDPETNSTTNHIFYKALGRLHGPQCQQPLRNQQHALMMIKTKSIEV